MELPSLHGIGQYFEDHRQVVLIILSIIELLVLAVVFLRWYDRRHGLRGTLRRVRRLIAATGRELIRPLVRAIRFRRRARLVQACFTGPDPLVAAQDALVAVATELTVRPDWWPYLVRLGATRVSVAIAGPGEAPELAVRQWQVNSPRRWNAARPLPELPDEQRAGAVPVAVGVAGDDLVLLDLTRSPGIVSVHGATTAADQLVAAIAAQLSTLTAVDRLLMADGIHPVGLFMSLPEALTMLEQQRATGRSVLVCARPEPASAARIAALTAADPGLVVIVAGYLPGSRWRLRVNPDGRVYAPELGLDVDSSPLWRGLNLARTVPAGPVPPPVPPALPPALPAAPAPAWALETASVPSAASAVAPAPVAVAPPTVAPPAVATAPAPVAVAPEPPAQRRPLPVRDDLIEPGPGDSRALARSGADPDTTSSGDR